MRASARVYPRVSGETTVMSGSKLTAWGLSPRERGNPVTANEGDTINGSIPA